jgi:putative pyruvate formate lyase activating enzyme
VLPEILDRNMDQKIRLIEKALAALTPHLDHCRLCPRECGTDRRHTRSGFCGGGGNAVISTSLLHFGEEPVISGLSRSKDSSRPSGGSGTVFFSGCNLKCVFCQNHQISWEYSGRERKPEELAEMMLSLQAKGALNINLVSPTIWILPILEALRQAFSRGLVLPILWNSGGYEKPDILRHLDGIVDIYLPDLKYMSSEPAERYSAASDYFRWASEALKEMSRQQPAFKEKRGAAAGGLIVRHLVLPGLAEDSLALLDWMDKNLPPTTGLSLMSQYHPHFRAPEEIRRTLTAEEYARVLERARGMDIDTLFFQPEPFGDKEHLIPDFNRNKPFHWPK